MTTIWFCHRSRNIDCLARKHKVHTHLLPIKNQIGWGFPWIENVLMGHTKQWIEWIVDRRENNWAYYPQ